MTELTEYGHGTTFQYANKAMEWIVADTQEIYDHNMQHRYDTMVANGWDKEENKFAYIFNSNGFRCDEFADNIDNIVFLGCSNTFGFGMPIEKTWPHIVAEQLQKTNYNLSTPGGSSDSCFRLGNYWIPRLKPSIVIMLQPSVLRLELIAEERDEITYEDIGPWVDDYVKHNSLYSKWIANQHNGYHNSLKNELAVQHIAESNGAKFLLMTDTFYFHEDDLARDLGHGGEGLNLAHAERTLEKLNS